MLTCQRVLRAYVLTYQRALRVLRAHVLTCHVYLSTYVLTCQRAFPAYVPTCFAYLRAPGKNLGKCTMYIGIEVIPRLFCPAFSFSSILIQRPFGKNYLNSKLQFSERWLIQVGWCLRAGWQSLMLWSKINSVLQFIYWASIYLLKVTGENTTWMYETC